MTLSIIRREHFVSLRQITWKFTAADAVVKILQQRYDIRWTVTLDGCFSFSKADLRSTIFSKLHLPKLLVMK